MFNRRLTVIAVNRQSDSQTERKAFGDNPVALWSD